MTRRTVDVLNDSTTLQSRIDTVLAAPDLDWANDSGWQPGDPLYVHPWEAERYDDDVQYVRQMVELIPEYEWRMRCESCAVSWSGPEACWLCGDPATERTSKGMTFGNIVLDETHDWGTWMAEAMRPMIEATNRMAQQFAEMQQRLHFTIDAQGQIRRLVEPEPEPVIRFPVGAEIAPVVTHDLPELTLALAAPGLYRRPADRYSLNRPVTETRRTREPA